VNLAAPCRGARSYARPDAPLRDWAFLLSLDLRWHACRVHNFGGPLWITGVKMVGGMSGSPIIDKDGRVIGVVCTGSESENIKDHDGLMRSLPRWMTPMR